MGSGSSSLLKRKEKKEEKKKKKKTPKKTRMLSDCRRALPWIIISCFRVLYYLLERARNKTKLPAGLVVGEDRGCDSVHGKGQGLGRAVPSES